MLYRVVYTCPNTGLRSSSWFTEDQKQECHDFVCDLQEQGVACRVQRRETQESDDEELE